MSEGMLIVRIEGGGTVRLRTGLAGPDRKCRVPRTPRSKSYDLDGVMLPAARVAYEKGTASDSRS